jgi:hypothetical protein
MTAPVSALHSRVAPRQESPGRILALCEGRGIRPGHSQSQAYLARAET